MQITAEELLTLDDDTFEEHLALIDHRADEQEIVEMVAELTGEPLSAEWKDDGLWVNYRGKDYKLPLTDTRHDRYVAISSLAVLLEDDYVFWLDENSLSSDTHGILVVTRQLADELTKLEPKMSKRLTRLTLGRDYFHNLTVPYLGHEDHNPRFQEEAAAYDHALNTYRSELHQALKNDPGVQHAIEDMNAQLGTDQFRRKTNPFRLWFVALIVLWLIYTLFAGK